MRDNFKNSKLMHFAFLDTSAIDPTKNNYERLKSDFDLLKKHISKEKVFLISHEIVLGEIKNHITTEIKSKYEQMEALINCKEFVLLRDEEKYEKLFNRFETETMAKDIFNKFKYALKELDILMLKSDRVSINKLLKDYFDCVPPFGTGNKKSEFPDAIMYQALKGFSGANEKLHIISSDKDWERICENETNFICHKTIKSFLNYLNEDDLYCDVIKSYLESDCGHSVIIQKFRQIVNGIKFEVQGKYIDRQGVINGFDYEDFELKEIIDIGYKLDTINDIEYVKEQNYASINLICYADLLMQCYYLDEDNSIWDSEIHQFADLQYGKVLEKHEVIIPIEVKFVGNTKEDLLISEFNVIKTNHTISLLDYRTILRRELLNDYVNVKLDKFSLIRGFECPHCRQSITIDLISGDTECICSNERAMGIENEYEISIEGICCHCKNSYRISGKVWEYPINAYNYEENIKIEKFKD